MNIHMPISSTKYRSNIFPSSVEENGAGNANPSHIDTTILFRQIGFTCPRCKIRFLRFMLLFDSDDAIHPTREERPPGSADLVEEPQAPAGPESAAGSLDVAELDCST
jgi:hypothetical protein